MRTLPRSVAARVIARSLLVQGSWNYETLIGTGFAFTLLPALRHVNGRNAEAFRSALARHAGIFNSHPYLATVAAGAVTRLEADGVDPALVERFKSALRGSLGSLGDLLVWGAWRPAVALLGILLLLVGAAWWAAVVAFLVLYNALAVGLRVWGWNTGIRFGLQVGKAVREAPLQLLARRVGDAGALLAGAATVLAAAPAFSHRGTALGALLCAGAALRLGTRTRSIAAVALLLAWFIALAWGWSR